MRIISGKFKGKSIQFLKTKITRPLKDSVKENIFNILAHSNEIKVNISKDGVGRALRTAAGEPVAGRQDWRAPANAAAADHNQQTAAAAPVAVAERPRCISDGARPKFYDCLSSP